MNNSKATDFELIELYQQDDEEGFSELFKRYYPIVFKTLTAKNFSPENAEDMTSEIFIKLIDSLKSYKFEKPFEHYLRRVVRNKIFDFYRKKQIDTKFYNFEFLITKQVDNLSYAELEEIINLCLVRIQNLLRRTITVLWLEGFRRRQIAEQLNISIGTVHSNLERVKPDFKNCIKENLR